MASAPSLLGEAVRRGVVGIEDVRAGQVRVRPMSRSNPVHVVERGGDALGYVKQTGGAARLDGDDTVAVESALLRRLAPLGLAPIPLLSGGAGSVWMHALPGVEFAAINSQHLAHAAAIELGRALARLHRVPITSSIPVAPKPWPLLEQLPPSMAGGEHQPQARPILSLLNDTAIRAALDTAARQWQPNRFIHGDIASGNVIVNAANDGPVSVAFIDFELGGKGSPEHDLASADQLLTNLSGPDEDLAAAGLGAYWAAGGPALLRPEWRCVRALLTAWQAAMTHADNGADEVGRLLEAASTAANEVMP